MTIQLTPEQTKALQDLDRTITTLKQEIARAKRAGIDVADLEAALDSADKTRKALLREYGAPATRVS